MGSKKGKPAEPQYLDADPKSEWRDFSDCYVIQVSLPGFKKEEFKVQADSSGKLTVKGQMQLADGRYCRLLKVFELPPDSIINEITGQYESNILTLIIPKRTALEKAETQKEKNMEAQTKEEVTKGATRGSENLKSNDRFGAQSNAKEEVAAKEDKKQEQVKNKVAAPEEPAESTKGEQHIGTAPSWRRRITAHVDRWSNSKLITDAKEKINKNKEVLAVAVVAFSVGFLISCRICRRK